MCAPPLLPNVGGGDLLYLKFVDFCRDKSDILKREMLVDYPSYRNVCRQVFSLENKGRVPGASIFRIDLDR